MTQHDTEVKTVLSRMKKIYGVEKDAELARALDISPQTLSSWRQRSAIPYALCVECANAKGASLDWILYGEGGIKREINPAKSDFDESSTHNNDLRSEILDALSDLPPQDLEDILKEASHRKRLRALEQRFEALQSQFFNDTKKKAV